MSVNSRKQSESIKEYKKLINISKINNKLEENIDNITQNQNKDVFIFDGNFNTQNNSNFNTLDQIDDINQENEELPRKNHSNSYDNKRKRMNQNFEIKIEEYQKESKRKSSYKCGKISRNNSNTELLNYEKHENMKIKVISEVKQIYRDKYLNNHGTSFDASMAMNNNIKNLLNDVNNMCNKYENNPEYLENNYKYYTDQFTSRTNLDEIKEESDEENYPNDINNSKNLDNYKLINTNYTHYENQTKTNTSIFSTNGSSAKNTIFKNTNIDISDEECINNYYNNEENDYENFSKKDSSPQKKHIEFIEINYPNSFEQNKYDNNIATFDWKNNFSLNKSNDYIIENNKTYIKKTIKNNFYKSRVNCIFPERKNKFYHNSNKYKKNYLIYNNDNIHCKEIYYENDSNNIFSFIEFLKIQKYTKIFIPEAKSLIKKIKIDEEPNEIKKMEDIKLNHFKNKNGNDGLNSLDKKIIKNENKENIKTIKIKNLSSKKDYETLIKEYILKTNELKNRNINDKFENYKSNKNMEEKLQKFKNEIKSLKNKFLNFLIEKHFLQSNEGKINFVQNINVPNIIDKFNKEYINIINFINKRNDKNIYLDKIIEILEKYQNITREEIKNKKNIYMEENNILSNENDNKNEGVNKFVYFFIPILFLILFSVSSCILNNNTN